MMDEHKLWLLYQQTQFLLDQNLCDEVSFAIVTACNPKGELMPTECNRVLDNSLQREIGSKAWVARSVYGCSPDFSHRERSWALLIDRAEALSLGTRYQQNAIFWVESGELFLLPCMLQGFEEMHLGKFRTRVTLRA